MRQLLVPKNLNMRIFGEDAPKIAMILDYMYRAETYKNDYGFDRKERVKYPWKSVAINMAVLKKIVHENPRRLMEMICQLPDMFFKAPKEKVLYQIKPPRPLKHKSARYVFAREFRTKPVHFIMPRTKTAKFRKRDREERDRMIASWPKEYQIICEYIKKLTFEMTAGELEDLIRTTLENYLQNEKKKYIQEEIHLLRKIFPKKDSTTLENLAESVWENSIDKTIEDIGYDHYDEILFIRDKFLEAQHEDELPIYSLDEQGRLHYFLTNMSEELRPYVRLDGCKMVSYDLGTSQCVFIWLCLRDYIQENKITLDDVKNIADEIMSVIRGCDSDGVPDYVSEGFAVLKRKRSQQTLDKEMQRLGRLLGKDFYHDIMETIRWKKLPNGEYDRKSFKSQVLFAFMYGKNLGWKENSMMKYFLKKFPAVYCALWKMRNLSNVCRTFYRLKDGMKMRWDLALERTAEIHNTSDFPKQMQRKEAEMFYGIIAPQINQPFVTIHDSIIVQDGVSCKVKQIIKQSFRETYGIKVRVTRERWLPPTTPPEQTFPTTDS